MKSFLLYALSRLFFLIPFLIGLTILAFLLGVLAPGDPAMAVLIMDGTDGVGASCNAGEHGAGSAFLDAVWELAHTCGSGRSGCIVSDT